jgi:hypothetical protein
MAEKIEFSVMMEPDHDLRSHYIVAVGLAVRPARPRRRGWRESWQHYRLRLGGCGVRMKSCGQ